MKSLYFILAFIYLLPLVSIAQSKWGIEFKGSRFNTTNSGKLLGDEYQQDESDRGTFLPKSIGLEFSIIYEFGKSIDKETEVR